MNKSRLDDKARLGETMDLVMKLVSGLFFLGWIGSIVTVVLFAGELLRTVISKDDPEPHSTRAEDLQVDTVTATH